MALTYGIESLAVINKGGGLRRLASGQTTEYLRGDMTWATFPTAMTPTAHDHSASEINSGTLALARIPTGTTASTVALGNHTHLYAGSASAGGAATTATKLASQVTLTIGSKGKSFDGSTSVTWSLADIGASPSGHNHDATYLKLSGGTLTGNLTMAAGTWFKNLNTNWDNNKIPYFVSGEMTVGTITTSSFALANHDHSTNSLTSGTLGVARGGTGKTSFTAYGLLLGGTTSTGALQSMGMGTARQLLASSGTGAAPQWLTADEYERFSMGGTAVASATQIGAKTGISEKLVFIDPGAETTPQTVSYFKAPLAANQAYGDRIVLYCCSGNENYKYIVVPSSTEKFCDLIGGQYTGNIEASYGNKIELVCLPKSGAKAWYVSRIALINNN